ncbi:hypothetical protein DL768_003932 [Monosporascus sp. mg162]|nr:hypothetical protein DL768_003932 [Monosporascus sp. mg162]
MADSNDPKLAGIPMFPPPVNPSDPGRGPLIMGLTWSFSSLCLIVVGVRFWVRITVTKLLSVEDWLMLAAGILNLICQSFATVSYEWGMGKHDRDLTFDQTINVLKWIWMSSTPGILPVEGVWNPMIPARRWDPNLLVYMGYVGGSLFALGDLTYVLFPVMVVWKLNMQFHRKVCLCILLALSLFTMGISITKATNAQGRTGTTDDALYNACMGSLWAITEQTFVIMMGCAPPLSSITKLKLTSITNTFSSLRRLIGSSSTGYKTDDSTGLGQYIHGAYYELGVAGQTVSQVHAGTTGTSLDKTDSRSIDTGKIRRTDQYMVTSDQGKETRRLDMPEADSG